MLWAVRRWVDDVRQGTRDLPHLADGFAAAQLTDALPDFLIMMDAIAGGVRRPLEVRCLPCNRVSPDEAICSTPCAAARRMIVRRCSGYSA